MEGPPIMLTCKLGQHDWERPQGMVGRSPSNCPEHAPAKTAKAPGEVRHSCGGCTLYWSGNKYAHCSVCHRTFSTPGNFDRHRISGECVSPVSLEMVSRETGNHEVWYFPAVEPVWD